ncbi:hypothetical protein [Streptomyces sp. NBC_01235]|uniref:hypothetical protein n=1 Tax=Streptomyces sp. NBC_01235 TaxID=2903788 RepID=UPI002E0E9EF5|nr:hypothetical protein OG289_00375 [Streptomyces sp. NBC_01235]
MASVMGVLEARESAAQVRVEELRGEAERVMAELAQAETVLERRVIAVAELAEALAEAGPQAVPEAVLPRPVPPAAKVAVTGSVVPHWREGLGADALAPDYRRLLGVLESGPSEGLRVKELAGRLGLPLIPAKIEGVRSKVRRLVERGWLAQERAGVFTLSPGAGLGCGGPGGVP